MTGCCPTCGRPNRYANHTLHAGLVSALRKFDDEVRRRQAAQRPDYNKIHIRRDLLLGKDEWTNFSKLKWLGFVAQSHNGRKLPRGFWAITERGRAFLEGRLRIQQGIKTFNRRIVPNSAFGPMVGVRDFERKEATFEVDAPEPSVETLKQQSLNV